MDHPLQKTQQVLERAGRIAHVGKRSPHLRRLTSLLAPALALALASGPLSAAETASPTLLEVSVEADRANVSRAWRWTQGVQAVSQKAPGVGVEGQTNAEDLFNSWMDSGVSPEQAMELINVIMLAQSPVITQSPQAVQKAQALAERTRGVWAIESGEQAEAFLERHSAVALYQEGLVSDPELMNTLGGRDAQWEDVVQYWWDWSSRRFDEPLYRPEVGDQEQMQQAQQRLQKVAQRLGLASLRVPVSTWDSPKSLEKLAQRLEETGQALVQSTKMDGPVLGLGSRVHLTVGAPRQLGVTWPGENGSIHVHAAWEDLSHEWFHALEMAMRPGEKDLTVPGGATLSHELTTRAANSPLEQVWHSLSSRLELSEAAHGHDWLEARKARVETLSKGNEEEQWQAGYLMERHELLAFQWQAYFQLHIDDNHPAFDPRTGDGIHAPKPQQASDARQVWEKAMALVNESWWAPQLVVAPAQERKGPPKGP